MDIQVKTDTQQVRRLPISPALDLDLDKARIAVIGLGYVGLPLAVQFGRHFPTCGFDIDENRIAQLRTGRDRTAQVDSAELDIARKLRLSHRLSDLRECNVFILSVPTPIDECKRPELSGLIQASRSVGAALEKGNVVIYESTVYPGATEEVCVPILEEESGLTFNKDFFVGYSPERINPGDREHRLADIVKVTSGSTPETADFVDRLYRRIIRAGTFPVSSIRVAEAAKVIENTQRDVNIALINELAMLFNHMGIESQEVLEAAATKWNFLSFSPGLVGGHCIGVDPYYLTHKAQSLGYHPDIILAGRRINDNMGSYIAHQMVKAMCNHSININSSRLLVMGLTFKENCPDLRNTKVIDVINGLEGYGIAVDVYDPLADAEDARREYGVSLLKHLPEMTYDGIIVAVAHRQFVEMGAGAIRRSGKQSHVLFDLKGCLDRQQTDLRL